MGNQKPAENALSKHGLPGKIDGFGQAFHGTLRGGGLPPSCEFFAYTQAKPRCRRSAWLFLSSSQNSSKNYKLSSSAEQPRRCPLRHFTSTGHVGIILGAHQLHKPCYKGSSLSLSPQSHPTQTAAGSRSYRARHCPGPPLDAACLQHPAHR
eukprot:1157587-Pelagomonas_calceolata.AAC.6